MCVLACYPVLYTTAGKTNPDVETLIGNCAIMITSEVHYPFCEET